MSVCTTGSFRRSLVSIAIKRVSLTNGPCQARLRTVNINSDETHFYPFPVTVNKCGRSCDTIDNAYAQVCVPNKVKNMNVKVFNLMPWVNETRFLVQHWPCECKCRLNESECNSKQKWNHDECWCECKELDNWRSCKNDYMWNPSTCDFECNNTCKIDEYLDIKHCSHEKHLIGKFVLEWS